MDDIESFAAFLAWRYGARAVTLVPIVRDGGKDLYRLERPDAAAWLLRAAPPEASPLNFSEDAAVLALLEHHAYPAPRVVSALDGSAVTECSRRPVLVTTFIEGQRTSFLPSDLRRLSGTSIHCL